MNRNRFRICPERFRARFPRFDRHYYQTDENGSSGRRRRAGAVEMPAEVFEEIAAEAGYDPQDRLVRDELLAALEVAIEALPEKQRDALRAQALEGVTFKELAERTGESIDTLMARKRYAIRKLAEALEYWMDFET